MGGSGHLRWQQVMHAPRSSPAALVWWPRLLGQGATPTNESQRCALLPQDGNVDLRKSISTTQDAVLSRPVGLPMGSLTRGFLMWGNM